MRPTDRQTIAIEKRSAHVVPKGRGRHVGPCAQGNHRAVWRRAGVGKGLCCGFCGKEQKRQISRFGFGKAECLQRALDT